MKRYKVDFEWTRRGTVEVQADSEREARLMIAFSFCLPEDEYNPTFRGYEELCGDITWTDGYCTSDAITASEIIEEEE